MFAPCSTVYNLVSYSFNCLNRYHIYNKYTTQHCLCCIEAAYAIIYAYE